MRKKSTSRKPTAIVPRPDKTAPGLNTGGRIVQVILNADLRNSHDGLLELARKAGVNLRRLAIGEYIVFLNPQRNRFKILAPAPGGRGTLVISYKSYAGRVEREDMEAVPLALGVRRKLSTGDRIAERLDERLRYQRRRRAKEVQGIVREFNERG